MSRTRTVLTAAQQRAVDKVTALHLDYLDAKPRVMAEAKRRAEEDLSARQLAVDLAVREAIEAGVPKAEFRRPEQGLHTSDNGAVLRSLKRTETLAQAVADATPDEDETDAVFRLVGDERPGWFTITPPADELAKIVHDDSPAEWETSLVGRLVGDAVEFPPEMPLTTKTTRGFMVRQPVVTWTRDNMPQVRTWAREHGLIK